MRVTVASVCEGISRMLSSLGTSVPRPRTCTIIGPRLTVSGHTVLASTVGAAGFKRYTAAAAAPTTTMPTTPMTTCRRSFFFLISGRAISIDERYCNYRANSYLPLTHAFSIICGALTDDLNHADWPFPEPTVRFRTISPGLLLYTKKGRVLFRTLPRPPHPESV